MTKHQYQKNIWQYRKRRDYLSKQIALWQRQLRIMEVRESGCENLIKAIDDFFDVNIRSKKQCVLHRLARKVYYKYGMENGFDGTFLSRAIGLRCTHTSANGRLKFTRSFESNPDNKQQYHNFKNHYEDGTNTKMLKVQKRQK